MRDEIDNRRNSLYKLIGIFIIFVSLCIILYDYMIVNKSKSLKGVSKLVINGHNKISKEEILKILDIQEDFSIGEYDLKRLEETLSKHPRIKKAAISKRSKDQLLISITEHTVKYILNSNDTLHEVNEENQVISTNAVKEENLVVLSGDFQLGKSNPKKLKDFTEAANQLFGTYPKLKERISEIHLSDDGEITVFTYFPSRIKIFVGNKLENIQSRKIYASLAFFENRSVNLRLLDLRGEDAVYQ